MHFPLGTMPWYLLMSAMQLVFLGKQAEEQMSTVE